VSRVVLRQFVEPIPKRGKLLSKYDLTTHRPPVLIGPGGAGWIKDFIAVDSEATEALWAETETELRPTFAAIAAGTALGNAAHERILRRVVALHFVRNPQALVAHRRSVAAASADLISELTNAGLIGAGGAVARSRIVALHARGALWRLSVQRLFEAVSDGFELRPVGLRVPANPGAEFLLGDYPAFGVMLATGQAGVDEFVGALGADEVVMPVAPRLTIIIGATAGIETVTDDEVEILNRLQVRKAAQFVHYRPSAPFAAVLSGWRP
jgi:hypothetical protein